MTEQLDLFANAEPADQPLTLADLDEWIADVGQSRAITSGWVPNDWARAGLGALLGEDLPYRRWTPGELLTALTRARRIAARA